jgi:acetylornithine deacetylase
VSDLAASARERVLGIAEQLIGFDTTVEPPPGNPPRDEQRCQEFIAELFSKAGFELDLWEPDVAELRNHASYIEGQNWRRRPNLVARLPGSSAGSSLLLNGHIDTVPAGDVDQWASGPWRAEVREGRLFGRGACDMKGGLASILAAATAIAESGPALAGDLLVGVVTDEEINGLGTVALLGRGYRADAAVVPEPNGLAIDVAFRGILLADLEVSGRAGHVEIPQPHHSVGGAVNAISKMRYLLDQLERVNEEWRVRPDKLHPLCSPGQVQVTRIEGGDFAGSVPAGCAATLNICYVPGEEDSDGHGGRVRREVESVIVAAARADTWLAANPPRLNWSVDFPPAEIDPDAALPLKITALLDRHEIPARRRGLDTWDDTASLIRGGIPAVSFGPGSNDQAHAVDEYVDVAELELHTSLMTELVMEWCGQSD